MTIGRKETSLVCFVWLSRYPVHVQDYWIGAADIVVFLKNHISGNIIATTNVPIETDETRLEISRRAHASVASLTCDGMRCFSFYSNPKKKNADQTNSDIRRDFVYIKATL